MSKKPLRVIVTAGGGADPVPVFDQEFPGLTGGDTLTINLHDRQLIVTNGEGRPVRFKYHGLWYAVGREVEA